MKTMNRVAKPCGIVGGVLTILPSLFVFVFTPKMIVTTATWRGETEQLLGRVTEKAFASGNLALLIFTGVIAMMGVLALVAVLSLKTRPQLRSILMWVSIISIFILGIFSLGPLLLPAVILLILAAIGMGARWDEA
jgi:hypothetical protein